MRVLVAEDEPRVAEAVARGLRREGAAVDVALDGRSALAKARAFDYDVVVLYCNLPGTHGDDVCRAVNREVAAYPHRLATAYNKRVLTAGGLVRGDYVAKAFPFQRRAGRARAGARSPRAHDTAGGARTQRRPA